MAIDYAALKTELTNGHPSTGAYNVDDATAASELNAVNRADNGAITKILEYIVVRNHRTQQDTDNTFTTILGRLYHAAESAVGSDPFGRGTGNEISMVQVHACKFFVALFESPHIDRIDYSDANLPTGQVNGAGVWSSAHATAIDALSDNQISRAEELGFGEVTTGDVSYARSI